MDLFNHLKDTKLGFFKPQPHYSKDGDSLTFFFRNEPYYAERVDDFLSVYKSMENDELVGCQVKGLPDALRLLGDFGLEICDGKVTLGMVFIACMTQTTSEDAKQAYRDLAPQAAKVALPADDIPLVAAV